MTFVVYYGSQGKMDILQGSLWAKLVFPGTTETPKPA